MNNIKSYSTAYETAKQLAAYIREQVNVAERKFYLAVSGGSTPKMLFEALVDIKNEIDWTKVMLYWVDERCVPPTDNESNYKMTQEVLLSYVPLSKENIHRMKGELDPKRGLADYELVIKDVPEFGGYPVFDLIILGMGGDGHTASIFPTEKFLIEMPQPLAIGTNPYSQQKRLTLSGQTIMNAKSVVFHVTGKQKASVISEIFNRTGHYLDYPAYYISKSNNVEWYVDQEVLNER